MLGAAALLMLPLLVPALPQASAAKKAKKTDHKAQQSAPVFGQLYPGDKHELPIHGWQTIIGGVQCDANGNMYMLSAANLGIATSSRQGPDNFPVTRIDPGSGDTVKFDPASPSGYAGYYRPSIYVGPRGTVYALIVAYKKPPDYHKGPNVPDILVVEYNDDGTVDSVTKLEPPPGPYFLAYKFAVFPDGSFLLTGNLVSGTPGVSRHLWPTAPFTWIFGPGGSFEVPVALAGDVHAPDKNWMKEGRKGGEWTQGVPQGAMLGSIDGTVYLYRASDPVKLYAVSSDGSVSREVTIKPPEPGMRPMQASLNGNGQILMQFRRPGSPTDPNPPVILTLADLEKGDIVGNYKIPSGAGSPACANPRGGFLFLNLSKQGNMQVQTFAPE